MQALLPDELPEMPISKVMEVIENKLIYSSEQHQDELRAAARKVRLTPGQAISEYITKHKILRTDMAKAGCAEMFAEDDNERTTLQHIINGIEENAAWDQLRAT